MRLAEEERDKVEEDKYTQLRCESPHRAQIHKGNKDEMIEEEQDREEEDKDTMSKGESRRQTHAGKTTKEKSAQLKDPPKFYYYAVHLTDAFKKKGTV